MQKYSNMDEETVLKKLFSQNKNKDFALGNWKKDEAHKKHLAEKLEEQYSQDEIVKFLRSKKKAAKVQNHKKPTASQPSAQKTKKSTLKHSGETKQVRTIVRISQRC